VANESRPKSEAADKAVTKDKVAHVIKKRWEVRDREVFGIKRDCHAAFQRRSGPFDCTLAEDALKRRLT
jgi:hypothetical protein